MTDNMLMDEGRIEENPVSNKIRRIRTGGQSGRVRGRCVDKVVQPDSGD